MSLSNEFETRALTWMFTADAVTRPTAWYIAAYTAAPSDAGGGTEATGGSYARKQFTPSVSGDLMTNSGALEFVTATASWGTITHIGIFDAATGGNLISWGALTTAKTIDSGDILRFDTGELDVTLD